MSRPELVSNVIAASDETAVVIATRNSSPYTQIWTTALPHESGAWTSADIPWHWMVADVVYGHGVFVAVGMRFLTPPTTAVWLIATSTDGLHWEEATISQ